MGQTLYATEGVGLVQARGGEILEIRPGDVMHTPPGEEHWRAAAPENFMEHRAMLEDDDDPATTTTWLEPVSDAGCKRPLTSDDDVARLATNGTS
jgi:quercetin dioxygenase-like cupin family protein